MEIDEWIDEKRVAQMICYSRSWLQQGRWKGYGPPYIKTGVNGSVRYSTFAVIEWMKSHLSFTNTTQATNAFTKRKIERKRFEPWE